MRNIFLISGMTIVENLRKKILYLLLFVGLLLIVGTMCINVFSLGAQARIIKDLSLSGINLFSIILSFSLMVTSIPNEIEKKIIYPILAKPISRMQYLTGKFLGVYVIVCFNLFVLALELLLVLLYIEKRFCGECLYAILLIFVECGVIQAMVLFFSIFFTPAITFSLVFLIYGIGEFSHAYIFLMKETAHFFYVFVAMLIGYLKKVIPYFDYFHIKTAVVHNYPLSLLYIIGVCLYGLMYIFLFLLLSDIAFSRKDL